MRKKIHSLGGQNPSPFDLRQPAAYSLFHGKCSTALGFKDQWKSKSPLIPIKTKLHDFGI